MKIHLADRTVAPQSRNKLLKGTLLFAVRHRHVWDETSEIFIVRGIVVRGGSLRTTISAPQIGPSWEDRTLVARNDGAAVVARGRFEWFRTPKEAWTYAHKFMSLRMKDIEAQHEQAKKTLAYFDVQRRG